MEQARDGAHPITAEFGDLRLAVWKLLPVPARAGVRAAPRPHATREYCVRQ